MTEPENPSTPSREEALFQAAAALATAPRAAFLDQECAGDPALRARLEALLAAHEQTGTLFGTAAAENARHALCLNPARELAEDAVGQDLGRYRLLEKLGEGGCGVVYLAEQTEGVRRRVALKVIKLGLDTREVIARFEAERQALALMDHPPTSPRCLMRASWGRGQQSEVSSQRSAVRGQRSER
jgi:predicted Zn-dependent protease